MPQDEERIFDEALAYEDPSERTKFLHRACGQNSALRVRISALLESYFSSEFLDNTAEQINSLVNEDRSQGLINSHIGPYLVLELIGEGGMGLVFLAEDSQSAEKRRVALKVIKPELDSRQVWERFQLEQEALKSLDHASIARFLDSGVTDQRLAYIAMELVPGMSITDYCNRERLPIEERLKLLIEVSHAVHYAHTRGIVHRDLKPENILVTVCQDMPQVRIIDFGVAKAVFGASIQAKPMTHAFQIVGTPNYMSPEQSRWSSDVDERSDVYSLGAVLYELLTGTPPVNTLVENIERDRSIQEQRGEEVRLPSCFLSQLAKEELVTVSAQRSIEPNGLRRTIKGDLDWITMKATEFNRRNRYQTVGEFADDLERFINHLPITAKAPSTFQRWRRYVKRNRAIVASALTSFFGILAIFCVVWAWTAIRHSEKLKEEIEARSAASEVGGNHLQFVHDLQSFGENVRIGQSQSAAATLDQWLSPDSPYRDHFVLNYIRGLTSEPIGKFEGHQFDSLDMDLSPDNRLLASCDRGGEMIIWDTETGRELRRIRPSSQEITRVRFSPNGQLLAVAGQDRIVRLFDVAKWNLLAELPGHVRTINGLDWSPDGNLLASGDRDGVVRIWDASDRKCKHILPKHQEPVRCLKWSPNGKWLASADGGIGVHLWSTADWSERHFIKTNGKGALAIAFTLDSHFIALGGYLCELLIVDTEFFTEIQRTQISQQIGSLTFGRHDELLLGGLTGELELFQFAATTKRWESARRERISNSESTIRSVEVATAQNRIYAQSETDRTIFMLSHDSFVGCDSTDPLPIQVGSVAESKLVLLSDEKGANATLRHAETGRIEWVVSERVLRGCRPMYSARRDMVVLACAVNQNSQVQLFRRSTGESIASLEFPGILKGLSMSRDSRYLAASGWNGTGLARVWDLETMKAIDLAEGNGEFEAIAEFCPSDDLLVVGPAGTRKLTCLKSGTWEKIRDAETSTSWGTFRFSESGGLLIVGETNKISVWDSNLKLRQWSSTFDSNGKNEKVFCIAITPDESTIVGYSGQTTIRFWDCRTQAELFSHTIPRGTAESIIFPDSNTLHVHAMDGWFVLSGKTAAP